MFFLKFHACRKILLLLCKEGLNAEREIPHFKCAENEAERRHSDSERSALGVFRVNALPRSCWKREHKKQQIHMVESNQKCYNLKDKMQDVVVGDRNS